MFKTTSWYVTDDISAVAHAFCICLREFLAGVKMSFLCPSDKAHSLQMRRPVSHVIDIGNRYDAIARVRWVIFMHIQRDSMRTFFEVQRIGVEGEYMSILRLSDGDNDLVIFFARVVNEYHMTGVEWL